MTLPKINRRDALALWLQGRRRGRRAPQLRPQYPGLLVWEWPYPNPYQWRVYWGHSDIGPWNFVEDYWHYGASRQFAPDGGSPYHLVVGVDQFGNEVTGRSNAVRPDDAPEPATLLTDLAGYWNMDEAASSVRADATGNDWYLEEWSFVEAMGVVGHVPVPQTGGFFNYAAQFEFGPGEALVSFAPNSLLNGDFTFACWFNYNSDEGFDGQGLISLGGTVWIGVRAYDGAVNFGIKTDNENGYSQAQTPNASFLEYDWTHVAFVRAGGTLRIYVNGAECANAALTGSIVPEAVGFFTETDLIVGINPWGYPLVGAVDELGCWQRALSAAEVGQLYNSGDGLAYEMF